MIEQAFGQPLEELFSEFNPKAVGSATIGQAHEARLRGTHQPVIVKIQYPEVQRLFGLDFSTLRRFVRLAQPEHAPLFDEFERAFQIEFDFRREARALEIIGQNIMPRFPNVVIPRPIAGLASEFVLVMEKLDGTKLIDALKVEQAKMAATRGIPVEELEREMMAKYVSGELYREAQRKYTPSALLVHTYASLRRTLNRVRNALIMIYNYSWVPLFRCASLETAEERVVINPHEIIDLLNEVHAHEIFIDGIFNGDPHPGNIFLLKNGKIGRSLLCLVFVHLCCRLGLIDFGQVQELTHETRYKLAKLIVLLAEGPVDELVKHYISMGVRTRRMDPYVLEKLARLGFDRDDPDVCEGTNAQLFFEELAKRDEILQIAEGYLMIARVGILLRGLGTWLHLPHSTAEKWLPKAKEFLRTYHPQSISDTRRL
jgi:aarF domain-containing kinase